MMILTAIAGITVLIVLLWLFSQLKSAKEDKKLRVYRASTVLKVDNLPSLQPSHGEEESEISEKDENSKREIPLPEIFLKRALEEIWEGRYVPFTISELREEFEVEIRSRVKKIPPLPMAINRLLSVLGDIAVSTKRVTELVSGDPVLVGKLLEIVNSSFYGLSTEIKSVGRAIVLLGFNTVKDFVLKSNLSKVIPSVRKDLFSINDFWLHSLCTSSCAYFIASRIPGLQPGNISTVALLHDIGKLALAVWKPLEYKGYLDEIRSNTAAQPIMVEEKVFGLHHALVGSLLAENWNLPKDMCDIILYHHHPVFVMPEEIPEECRVPVTIIHFANVISKLCGLFVDHDVVVGTREEYFRQIGKRPPVELLIEQKCVNEIQRIKHFRDASNSREIERVN